MVSWLVIIAALVAFAALVVSLMDRVYLDLTGRYVLVTGCDSGFGNILAKYLGPKRGCHVIAGCLTRAGMEDVMSGAPKGTVTAIPMDVTDTKSILQAREEVVRIVAGKGKCLWGLVNNAGVTGNIGPIHWHKKREIQRILDVNLMGTIEVTNVFFPLIRQGQGRIVNVSSALALLPAMVGGYSISKIGVEAFSDTMRTSSKAFGVTVHILEPGYFKTNITSVDVITASAERMWKRLPPQERDIYGQEYFDTLKEKVTLQLLKSSPKLHLVTDAMEHALCARWPWRRYMPGMTSSFYTNPLYGTGRGDRFHLGVVSVQETSRCPA
ncbi:retinol dehydrogenase 7-like [Strongylocentrotus purpuratus]|uniref:Uncharacterized protein n=1 Tax=Strongylocentrotus purpuratus TaxID=7668 RepID=A0A7M7NHG2_STRPU|nr:retinol dehydrogenase 7-like [Strongylocentrotus purpuratus]